MNVKTLAALAAAALAASACTTTTSSPSASCKAVRVVVAVEARPDDSRSEHLPGLTHTGELAMRDRLTRAGVYDARSGSVLELRAHTEDGSLHASIWHATLAPARYARRVVRLQRLRPILETTRRIVLPGNDRETLLLEAIEDGVGLFLAQCREGRFREERIS